MSSTRQSGNVVITEPNGGGYIRPGAADTSRTQQSQSGQLTGAASRR